jgi:uncharacterized protein YbbK (DUF523 family)
MLQQGTSKQSVRHHHGGGSFESVSSRNVSAAQILVVCPTNRFGLPAPSRRRVPLTLVLEECKKVAPKGSFSMAEEHYL